MNTTLSRTRQEHPPQLEVTLETQQVSRVGLVDRIALHLGLALITWSRRTHRAESRERRAHQYEQNIARLERERAAERSLRLTVPQR